MIDLVRPRKAKLSIDLAPLIDVVFQLLVFFMLTSTFANPAIRLNLPRAVTNDRQQQERIVVTISSAGDIFINQSPTSLSTFQVDLQKALQNSVKKSIHIKGDEDMAYKYFVNIMDMARQAGAKQVNIVHEN